MIVRLLYDILMRVTSLLLFQADVRSKLQAIADEQQSQRDYFTGLFDQVLAAVTTGPAVKLIFHATLEDQDLGEITMIQLTDTQKVTLSIQPVDAKGNPALVDGAPTWNSSDPSIITVVPSADGLSAVASAAGPLTADGASVQVSVTADADLGAGVETISGTMDVTVVASKAVSVAINAGAPEEQ